MHTTERTPRGLELHINGEFFGWFGSHAAAERFRKLVQSGRPLSPETKALIANARAEKADRDNRGAVRAIAA
jgi:hypothetical protein